MNSKSNENSITKILTAFSRNKWNTCLVPSKRTRGEQMDLRKVKKEFLKFNHRQTIKPTTSLLRRRNRCVPMKPFLPSPGYRKIPISTHKLNFSETVVGSKLSNNYRGYGGVLQYPLRGFPKYSILNKKQIMRKPNCMGNIKPQLIKDGLPIKTSPNFNKSYDSSNPMTILSIPIGKSRMTLEDFYVAQTQLDEKNVTIEGNSKGHFKRNNHKKTYSLIEKKYADSKENSKNGSKNNYYENIWNDEASERNSFYKSSFRINVQPKKTNYEFYMNQLDLIDFDIY